jgi:hypothetical protein
MADNRLDIAHAQITVRPTQPEEAHNIPGTTLQCEDVAIDVGWLSRRLLRNETDLDIDIDSQQEQQRLCKLCRRFLADILSGDATIGFFREQEEESKGRVLEREKGQLLNPTTDEGDVWEHEVEDTEDSDPDEWVTFRHQTLDYFSSGYESLACEVCRVFLDALRKSGYQSESGSDSSRVLLQVHNTARKKIAYEGAIAQVHMYYTSNDTGQQRNRNIGYCGIYLVEGGMSSHELVKRSTLSSETFDFVREALEECTQSHELCYRGASVLPTRVIDVGNEDESRDPFLYATKEGEIGSYATLSYCWGGWSGMRTTEHTLSSHLAGMRIKDMPATFRHAIQVCRWLHIRYLWIDALCIVQGNEADWAREATHMGRYYGQASLVISAYQSVHTAVGFLFQRSARVLSLPGGSDICLQHLGVPGEKLDESLSMGTVNRRAWCLQEHGLAKARIYLGADNILWECCTGRILESRQYQATHATLQGFGALNWKFKLDAAYLMDKNFNRLSWCAVLNEYSLRRLTVPQDKLAAIAGIARWFEERGWKTGRYMAGLWESDLYVELFWRKTLLLAGHSGAKYHFPENLGDLFPSWSWASINHGVEYLKELGDITYPTADGAEILLDATVVDNHPKTARSVQGSIALNARLQLLEPGPYTRDLGNLDAGIEGWYRSYESNRLTPSVEAARNTVALTGPESKSNGFVDLDRPPEPPCWALKFCSAVDWTGDHFTYFLLLNQVREHHESGEGAAEAGLDVFRRFGIAKVRRGLPGDEKGIRRTIRLV